MMDKSTTTTNAAKAATDANAQSEAAAATTNASGCGSSSSNNKSSGSNSSISNSSNGNSSSNKVNAGSNGSSSGSNNKNGRPSAMVRFSSDLLRDRTYSNNNPATTTIANCGTAAPATPAGGAANALINLNISTTTGGNFAVSVEPHINVESLKKIIAKKLKVAKDRICLLHREK